MPSCCGAGAHHAEPPVVIDVRCLETDASELAEQIRLFSRQARAAEQCNRLRSVRLLDAADFGRGSGDRVRIRHRREPVWRRRIAPQCGQQTIRMGALQVPLDAFRAQHAAVERKFFPRLEADDLVVSDLQLNPALLSAETAMRLHEPLGLHAG